MLYEIPGKTFLLGEYLALVGEPAVLLTNLPKFKITITAQASRQDCIHPFHIDSPAGKFIQKYKKIFNQQEIRFFDPYSGSGGFGASTAQFLAVYAFVKKWEINKVEFNEDEIRNLHSEYLNCSYDKRVSHLPPSGMDLVAQLLGGLVFIHKNNHFQNMILRSLLDDYNFLLFKTSIKIPTHEHLAHLNLTDLVEKNLNLEHWSKARQSVSHFFQQLVKLNQKKQIKFSSKCSETENVLMEEHVKQCIKQFNDFLKQENWIYPQTQVILDKLSQIPEVIAAKGCGALGADVVFVISKKENSHVIIRTLLSENLKLVSQSRDFSQTGLVIQNKDEL